jgi:signal transduction histidine kinase
VEVVDHGPGIAADDLPRIFERFYRASDRQGEDSTGLGLAIVAALVEAHDGEIEVSSRIARGTRVLVRLPLDGPADPEPS